MPCRSDYMEPTPDYRQQISQLEEMLCSACRLLSRANFDFAENPQLDKWWAAHEAADQRRRTEEAKKRQRLLEATELAGTKLIKDMTKEEKNLLKECGII